MDKDDFRSVFRRREYRGFSLSDVAMRPGSLDILKYSSLILKRKNHEGEILHDLPAAPKRRKR
jgi:hypothetical protein